MAHNPEWHAQYLVLENADADARAACRAAEKALNRCRTVASRAAAQAVYDAALDASRRAGCVRWEFEMAAAVIVDIATLPAAEWARSLRAA
jgi:hypothetical protein